MVGCVWAACVTALTGQAVFRSQTDAVRIDVSVTRDGVPVGGLRAGDFDVLDNGVRQTIRDVLVESVPMDVTLVLDTSTSVAGDRMAQLQRAARQLLNGLRPGDRAALFAFSHQVSRRQALTSDLGLLRTLIDGLQGEGLTALHDAVFAALLQPQTDARRSAVVVFSDGLDTISWLPASEVLATARRSDAIVYTVNAEVHQPVNPEAPRFSTRTFLKTIAEESGGRAWTVPDPAQFGDAFARILKDITTRYVLLYQPDGVAAGGWHTLSVKLTRAKADVTARTGYYRR